MFKLVACFVATVICAVLGLLPEIGLYILWHIIGPTEELSRVILGIAFLFFGGGLCIWFGIIALWLWGLMIAVVLD